jgi:2-polyprenyl-3-methyl-5-hydroxy-6-metoxy-1,4-benzoquinol methylase
MRPALLKRALRLIQGRSALDYSDIVPTYEIYADLQRNRYQSFESEDSHWREGQRRFIAQQFVNAPRDAAILDIACGDGVGLSCFRDMGFTGVTGVEFNAAKAERARSCGFPVHCYDMHDLSQLQGGSFDVVYSSHTIEHAYYPRRALKELTRMLRRNGEMIVVLPYPDQRTENDPAHGAKYELGTNVADGGTKVTVFFARHGLRLVAKAFDDFREPEIWLRFTPS